MLLKVLCFVSGAMLLGTLFDKYHDELVRVLKVAGGVTPPGLGNWNKVACQSQPATFSGSATPEDATEFTECTTLVG